MSHVLHSYVQKHQHRFTQTVAKTIGTANGNIQVAQQATVVLDANGEAEFRLASTHANDSARPVVWIDQNYDNASGNNTLEAGEPVSVRADVSPTNFQPVRVDNARLRVVDLTAEARAANFPGVPAEIGRCKRIQPANS